MRKIEMRDLELFDTTVIIINNTFIDKENWYDTNVSVIKNIENIENIY